MAKCGITNIGGGGGIGSDELTVTKDYVLSGLEYVGADTDDEKGVGIMINNGTTANQNLNAGGSFLVKGGYHAQPFTVNANSLASQTSATATSNKVLNGETFYANGVKNTGSIASMAGQTINPTASQQTVASSGKYLTGNVVVKGVSNLTASNIKKGAVVGGVTGTFQGYVPTATDLYLRGNNISGWVFWDPPSTAVRFESGEITVTFGSTPTRMINTSSNINLTGFSKLNIEVNVGSNTSSGKITLINQTIGSNLSDFSGITSGNKIISLDVTPQITCKLGLRFDSFAGSIYRIWLS